MKASGQHVVFKRYDKAKLKGAALLQVGTTAGICITAATAQRVRSSTFLVRSDSHQIAAPGTL